MSARAATGVLLAMIAACQADAPATERVRLGQLAFDVPAAWTRVDRAADGALVATWTPTENPRRESVTVIRAPRPNPGQPATPDRLGPQLVSASKGLRHARVSGYRTLTTPHGFAGAQLDVRFTPDAATTPYQRTHAVIAEDDATVVHVIYTAAQPAAELRPVQVVLDSLTRDGGRS